LRLITKNGASYYQFEKLTTFSGVAHGIFTRTAGYSRGPFRGLNISRGIGDDKRNVYQNRNLIAHCFGGNTLVFADQVHGNQVIIIDDPARSAENENSPAPLVGDALVTNFHHLFLVIQVADCQSIMLYDPKQEVIANVHVGWRGSVNGIIGRTISVMLKRFGCQPQDIIAGIGPSLGPCCAEFVNYRLEIPEEFWSYKDTAHHIDFWAISRDQLMASGVLPENINISRLCTKCNTDHFFSYRGEGTTGRFAAVIGLK